MRTQGVGAASGARWFSRGFWGEVRPRARERQAAARLLLALAGLGAGVTAPALAAEQHPRDYPDSPTNVSPAQLYRFETPALAVSAAYARTHQRQRWSGGDVTDDTSAAEAKVQLVRKASPSVYWGFGLTRRSDDAAAGDTATLGDRRQTSVRTATAAGPDAAYKILDWLVVGAGLRLRRVEARPDQGSAWALTYPALSQGLLVKSEWYEAGWSQTVVLINQDVGGATSHRAYRETVLHARYHSDPASAYGVIVRRNPLPPCCLAAATTQLSYTATSAWQFGAATLEALYTYAPAFVNDDSYDVTRHGVTAQLSYAFDAVWSLTARATYGFGSDRAAAVRLATPLGLATSADVLSISSGAAFGVVREL